MPMLLEGTNDAAALKVIGTNLLCCCLQPSDTDDAATDIATKLLMPLMLERSVVNQPP
jgi:hypothetical protein